MSVRIFISHKMPTNSAAAKKIGDAIAAASGPEITVINAAQFRYGTDFRSKIKTELETTDIFILLYTGEDADWSYCMWECGRFENFINSSNEKSIIVMHDSSVKPPPVLQIYRSLPVVENEIFDFLKEIYVTQWAVFPQVSLDTLQRSAQDITGALDKPVVINFDLVPNFGIKIPLSEESLHILRSSTIPSDALVTGSQGWQRFFEKDIDTGGWYWSNLTEGWLKKKLYEYEFSRMIGMALRNASPNGCLLKVEGETLYYINLSRVERIVGNNAGTFMFSAFKIDTPIYSVKGSATKEEVICYNILNIASMTVG